MAGVVLVLRPPAPALVDVRVAARDLSAVEPLAASDTVVRALPAATVPEGALGPDHPVAGGALRSPVRAGEVLTDVRLAAPPSVGLAADMVAAPVRVADPGAVALLVPGNRIDVLAATTDPISVEFFAEPARPARTVVTDRPVIAVPEAAAAEQGALLLIAVTEDEARELAGHAATGPLSITIRG
ncbi:hypothetical protein Nans01_13020 [Nocardiopsis ansamitocini]|uniref:SAF domain-containing protein n=1 Tax=Nocardiopsis ansamitocini TaxID=1670832 RepID=A0A9W6UG97_9ACTN|nr:hypothetical protein Nans01_13020 [Nocardiopsis ansamitocini]